MGSAVSLPAGFVLEEEASALPPGFILERRSNTPPPNTDPQLQVDSGWQEAQNVLEGIPRNTANLMVEGADAFNRSVMAGADFMGPGTINAALRVAGADAQLPTFTGGYETLSATVGRPDFAMAPGTTRDVVRGASGAAPAALGLYPVAGRDFATPVGAAAEFFGFGTKAPAPRVAPLAFGGYLPAPPGAPPSPATARLADAFPVPRGKQEQNALVRSGSESVKRAGLVLDPYTGKAAADRAGMETIKQGFDPGFVSMVETANESTRAKLAQMLGNQERGREFLREKSTGRASNVIGDSVLARYQVVRDANRSAGAKMDAVIDGLRGESVDVSAPVNQFVEQLKGMGIKLEIKPGGVVTGFSGSDIEGLDGIITGVKRILSRMANTKAPDAHDVHRLKKYIDETVTYGKSAEGLSGKTERALKELRAGLDGVLDQQFPAYNAVNTQYSETIQALDALQGVAGKKMDLTGPNADKALGTLMRRWASNAQSRVPLMDATTELDRLAKKYTAGHGKGLVPYRAGISRNVPDVSDDIETQVQFLSQLEKKFGSAADNSFMGDIGKANDRAAETMIDVAANPTMAGVLTRLGKGAYHKVRGINEENALIALNDLLKTKK